MASTTQWVSAWAALGSLFVAAAALAVAVIALRRTIVSERPFASLSLHRVNGEYFRAFLKINNASRRDLRLEKLTIDIPDFRLSDISEALVDDGSGQRVLAKETDVKQYIAMGYPGGHTILEAGRATTAEFLVFQAAHSQRKAAEVAVMFHTMEPRPKWRAAKAIARTRPDF